MNIAPASLVMTVFNEGSTIRSVLESLARQTVRPDEIVVVDGGSRDGTVEQLRRWDPPEGTRLQVIESPGAGISEGRNTAIRAARNERILVTDAGTALHSDWVEAMLEATRADPEPDIVSGFFYPAGETLLQRAIAFTITPELREIDPEHFLPSSRSVSFTKTAWEMVGGYPEWLDYCEDLVFDIALKNAGFYFAFQPRAQVSWSARPTLRSFMVQYYRYARGDGKANLWGKRHLVRYLAYLAGIVLALLGLLTVWAWLALAVCVVGYLGKFWRRILGRRTAFGSGVFPAFLLVPVVVVAGDLAKMWGYPRGLAWARDRRRR